MYVDMQLKELKGIGEKTSLLFEKLGLYTANDLLHYYPYSYDSYTSVVSIKEAYAYQNNGIRVAIKGKIASSISQKRVRSLSITTFQIKDDTGILSMTYFNMPYLKNTLKPNQEYVFYGRISGKLTPVMEQGKIFKPDEYLKMLDCLWPRYHLTKGLSDHTISKAVKQVLTQYEKQSQNEYLPASIVEKYALSSKIDTLKTIHFPSDYEMLSRAINRLSFEELFGFVFCLKRDENHYQKQCNTHPMIPVADTTRLIEALPYHLTNGQRKVWSVIADELSSDHVMNRMIQGDVGSGKTILAFLALLMTVANGYQAALMAPTEVLAKQHMEQLTEFVSQYKLPIKPVFLSGSVTAKNKKEIYHMLESGEANVAIGTHALIQDKVNYKNLALVITDEQHRFGVRQRETLANKGMDTHVLVMSATPIPRSLAILLYGEMHLSVLDEVPAKRLPIKNSVVDKNYRNAAYKFIRKEIESGHQAYIICPMVEGDDESDSLENVMDYSKKLRSIYDDSVQIGVLHGKMKPKEKNKIMEEFAAGNIHILVSTTVVEVGVNVPNATVIMIENAERFGLASLHQLRGRVGRSDIQSYCIFMSSTDNKESKKRLEILQSSNDGFYIADQDLKLRGPGDMMGTIQSGELNFRIADIYRDQHILRDVVALVDDMLSKDPGMEQEHNRNILQEIIGSSNSFVDIRTI